MTTDVEAFPTESYRSAEVYTAPVRISGRRPFHSVLLPFAVAYFGAGLLTDITYWLTADILWAQFAAWLVTVGVVIGLVTLILALIDLATRRSLGVPMPTWPWVIANLVGLALGAVNMFVHSRDAWTSVVPWGAALSAATVFAFLVAEFMRWSSDYRTGLGVTR